MHFFNYFVLEMAAIIVASRGTAEMRECMVEGRGFIFPHVIYLERKKNMKISFAKPCYFLFASGNKRRLGTLN